MRNKRILEKTESTVASARLGFRDLMSFAELGFKGDDLEMRTMLFVCYHSLELPMFPEISSERRRELIARRIELLTSGE